MVDEGAIKEALLTAQEKLIVAYGAGPAALDVYFLDFEALKKQIIDASRLGLLSSDTMQLAANVVGGIPAICQSFMALDKAAADAVAGVEREIQNLPLDCREDEDEFGGDGRDSDLSTDSDASSEQEADETDKDDESDDSNMDYGTLDANSDGESDSDSDLDPPKWELLRDWLLDNIAYPFARNELEHAEMLQLARIPYPSFLHWLKQMREHIQWDKFLQQHSKGDPRQFKHILVTAQDDPLSIPPTTLAAVSQMRTLVREAYEDTIPQWWNDVIGLVEEMEKMFWDGAVEEVYLGSREILTEDEVEDDAQIHTKAEVTPHPLAKVRDAVVPAGPSLLGTKRKALDMSTYEPPGLHEPMLLYVSHEIELPVAKRRKQEDDKVTLLDSCSSSPSAYSEVPFSGSGSSRATTYSPAPEASTSSSPPLLNSDSPVKQEAEDSSLFPLSLSPSSSLSANPLKVIHRPSTSASLLHEEAEILEKLGMESPLPPYEPNPQAQISTGIQPVPPYIRSSTIPFDRKRKRKFETEDYSNSQFESDTSSIPTAQLVTPTNIPTTHTDSKPSSICSAPNQPSINNTVPGRPPPFKRLRPNGSESFPSITSEDLPYHHTPLHPNKYKSDRKVDQGKTSSATSRSRPPATDRTQLVATSPRETQSGDRNDIGQLLRVLEEINVAIPGVLPLETNTLRFSLPCESPQTFNSSNWTQTLYSDPTTEDSGIYHHLLDPCTPLLSAASPNGESPYSCTEVATPATTADFAQDFSTASEFHNGGFVSSGMSAQIFDDLSANSPYHNNSG